MLSQVQMSAFLGLLFMLLSQNRQSQTKENDGKIHTKMLCVLTWYISLCFFSILLMAVRFQKKTIGTILNFNF